MTAESSDRTAQLNRQWSAIVIEACRQHGITDFFVAPGSRCTPLTMELARRKVAGAAITIHQHFDERALAFCCIGYGKATNRPGAFVCTSGTAVANAFPAVIESSAEDIPFLLLTADRPPELRRTGANQTIDQIELFGSYPRQFLNLECPHDDMDPADLHEQICFEIRESAHGPVHINCMFREPFDASDAIVTLPNFPDASDSSFMESTPPVSAAHRLSGGDTLVIASSCRRDVALAARELATRLNCPFLADVTSELRELAYDCAVTRLKKCRPQTVIHIGRRITSKRLLTFIDQSKPTTYVHINETDKTIDPLRRVTQQIVGHVESISAAITLQSPSSPQFLEAWQAASASAQKVFAEQIPTNKITEPAIAREIAGHIPNGSGLFLGNSMPVRDMDTFGFWEDTRKVRVASNRGASGIDGTIATAVGFAAGLANTTTAVIGDLASLHDLNALAMVASSRQPIVLVIINNDGGGIFHFLPVASQTEQFEQYFGTPHGRTFASAAQMFDLAYQAPTSLAGFRDSYTAALCSKTSSVIEVTTDRTDNAALHRRILERVRTYAAEDSA